MAVAKGIQLENNVDVCFSRVMYSKENSGCHGSFALNLLKLQ
jgi:hypothetical protein